MSSRLTYRSPDIETLGGYAREHRIDADAPIQARTETVIDAAPAKVWARLTDVDRWDEYLEQGVEDVHCPDGIRPGSILTRRQSGITMRARFEVVEPEHELAWTGSGLGVRVIHRFELAPEGPGTRVRAEESMAGRPMAALYSSAKLQVALQGSLAMLKVACER